MKLLVLWQSSTSDDRKEQNGAPEWRVPFSLYHLQSERSGGSFSPEEGRRRLPENGRANVRVRPSVGAIDPGFTAAAAGARDGGTDDVTSDGDWKE